MTFEEVCEASRDLRAEHDHTECSLKEDGHHGHKV